MRVSNVKAGVKGPPPVYHRRDSATLTLKPWTRRCRLMDPNCLQKQLVSQLMSTRHRTTSTVRLKATLHILDFSVLIVVDNLPMSVYILQVLGKACEFVLAFLFLQILRFKTQPATCTILRQGSITILRRLCTTTPPRG